MREIKFRAWDTVSGEWVETTNIRGEKNREFNIYSFSITPAEIRNNLIVEQYTGLKDKNGKEIYEGDVVEALIDGAWSTGKNTIAFGKAKWRLEVLYNDIRYMDVLRIIGSKNNPDRIYYLFDEELSDIEVIGNIHENPELLEEGK